MDPKRFDALVQSRGTPGSRRSALRRLGGTLIAAGLFTTVGAHAATGGLRSPRPRADSHADAQPNAASSGGRHTPKHACTLGLTRCVVGKGKHGKHKHACLDLQTDPQHCGSSDHAWRRRLRRHEGLLRRRMYEHRCRLPELRRLRPGLSGRHGLPRLDLHLPGYRPRALRRRLRAPAV
jgi:hypothetical protein